MATGRRISDYSCVLVVEGYSDLLFYAEALEWVGVADRVFIKHCNGRSDLDLKLQDLINPGFLAEKTHMGVIVDADQDAEVAEKRFASLLGTLTRKETPGCGWTKGSPRIGLWVAPGDGLQGEIESLVWKAWSSDPKNARPKACIESFMACMSEAGCSARSRDKAQVSSLLAIRNDEDPRLGPGARAGCFDFARPEFASLLEFLKGFGR